MTWKDIVADALRQLGGEATLETLTECLANSPQRPRTATWEATVRRVVRQYRIFEPFRSSSGRAAYRLVEFGQLPPVVDGAANDPHGEQQGLLLHIGRLCGYETYTNATDRTIRSMGAIPIHSFATVRNDSASISGLPLSRMRDVDVMWLSEDDEGLYPRYAFEVEHSTKVKSGLLRLLKIPKRFQTGLYIIGQGDEEEHLFERYMSQSPFRQYRERFRFHRYEEVGELHDFAVGFERGKNLFGIEMNLAS